MNRKERTEQKMQELFHSHAAGDEGTDGEFMQILQGYIFGDDFFVPVKVGCKMDKGHSVI